jgi:putative ABC transport system permease protein
MMEILQDLRFAVRALRRRPGAAAVVLLTLGVAIGVNTAVFSVLHDVLLRPLPFPEPERLMDVWCSDPPEALNRGACSGPDYLDWSWSSATFESLSAYDHHRFNLAGPSEPATVLGVAATTNFFDVFALPPVLGRPFTPTDDDPSAENVAVIGEAFWREGFSADPGILGREIRLDGTPYTVIGVAPTAMRLSGRRDAQVYVPLRTADLQTDRADRSLLVVGRLRPEVPRARAQGEIRGLSEALARRYPATNSEFGGWLMPHHQRLVSAIERPMATLFGGVCLLFLLACANVSSVLLARSEARTRETAVRRALGATRWQIARLTLVESAVLSAAGAALGLVLARGLLGVVRSVAPAVEQLGHVATVQGIDLGGSGSVFALGLAALASLLCGSMAAWSSARRGISSAETGAGLRVDTGGHRRHTFDALIVTEVALALVLSVGGGLLLHSFLKLQWTSPGFEARGVLAAEIARSTPDEPSADRPSDARFFGTLLSRVRQSPIVTSAGAVSLPPLSSYNAQAAVSLPGSPDVLRPTELRIVAGDYFSTMQIPLLRGRVFSATDEGRSGTAVVDEAFAERYLGGQAPVGATFQFPGQDSISIIGVVGDVKMRRLQGRPFPHAYLPLGSGASPEMTLVVRTDGDPTAAAAAVRQAVRETDAAQPVFRIRRMREVVLGVTALERFTAGLLAAIAGVALLLAGTGVYGVMAFAVGRRTRELGIRMALGAGRGDVVRAVVARAACLTLVGVALGLAGTAPLSRVVGRLLYETSPLDPAILAGASLVLTAVAVLAALLPTRRAVSLDPAQVLRHE